MAELTGEAKKAEARRRTAKRKEDEARENAEHTAAYNATRKKGYVPNRETILAQLEELYADSKISHQQCNWGIKGLDLVHGFVAMSEDVVDPEFGF